MTKFRFLCKFVYVPICEESVDGHAPRLIFFKVLDSNPSTSKTVRVPAASGRRRLARGDMFISLLPATATSTAAGKTKHMLSLGAPMQSTHAVHVLHTLGYGALQSLRSWQIQQNTAREDTDMKWYVSGAEANYPVSLLVTILMNHRATDQKTAISIPSFPDDQAQRQTKRDEAKRYLLDRGVLIQLEDGRAHLTVKGMKEVLPSVVVGQCANVHGLRSDTLTLAEMTQYELLLSLQSAGFKWKKSHPQMKPYKRGQEKTYYSGGYSERSLPCAYLQALLHADRDLAPTIVEVPHGLKPSAYESLLCGEDVPLVIDLGPVETDVQELMPLQNSAALAEDDDFEDTSCD
eukprot:1909440-Amphidinium_carterae.3